MPAGEWNPTIEEGATFQRVITWTDENGTAVNITGYTIRMQARVEKSDTSAVIDISTTEGSIALTTPTSGIFTITISATATAAYDFDTAYYDIECESAGGVVTRLLEGIITFSREVTR